jgi:hypothetical protein
MRHRASDDKLEGWQHNFSMIGTKQFRESPLAVSCGQGHLDVFAIEQGDSLVWHTSWNSSTGSESADGTEWRDWQSIGRLSIEAVSSQAAPSMPPHTSPAGHPSTGHTTRTIVSTTVSTTTRASRSGSHRTRSQSMLTLPVAMAVTSLLMV